MVSGAGISTLHLFGLLRVLIHTSFIPKVRFEPATSRVHITSIRFCTHKFYESSALSRKTFFWEYSTRLSHPDTIYTSVNPTILFTLMVKFDII